MLLFYISLIARGILFLNKCLGGNPQHLNWTHDQFIAYSIVFCEAFDDARAIVGAVLPERVPVAHAQKDGLKEFVYRQYVLLHDFHDLSEITRVGRNYQRHVSDERRLDPDLHACFLYSSVNLRHDVPRSELQVHVQYKHLFQGDFHSLQIKPAKIFKWMLKEPPLAQFQFHQDSRRWVFNSSLSQTKAVVNETVIQQ